MNLNKNLFNAVLNEIMVTNLLFEEGVKHLLREFVLPLYFTCTMLKRKNCYLFSHVMFEKIIDVGNFKWCVSELLKKNCLLAFELDVK